MIKSYIPIVMDVIGVILLVFPSPVFVYIFSMPCASKIIYYSIVQFISLNTFYATSAFASWLHLRKFRVETVITFFIGWVFMIGTAFWGLDIVWKNDLSTLGLTNTQAWLFQMAVIGTWCDVCYSPCVILAFVGYNMSKKQNVGDNQE